LAKAASLWQQNDPASPDQSTAFLKENFETHCFVSLIEKVLKLARKRLFKDF
jgi:hypothetical protein